MNQPGVSNSPAPTTAKALRSLEKAIHACKKCPRLRDHCTTVAEVKRKAYQDQNYWGKPVAGFGDPRARLYILGLAPAAHGANRTGRIFTGDRSGDWLYRALHKQGFSNQPSSVSREDGLLLRDAWVSCAVHCAPPENKPTPQEFESCRAFLESEFQILRPQVQVYIALGGLALKAIWPHLPSQPQKMPRFQHGAEVSLPTGETLLLSYHPSQQNTFTGRLTEPQFDQVFRRAKELLT
jgi:uracil-DNA glycosylase family 4